MPSLADALMVIDATTGGESANSYVTLAFADAYFADTLEAREWLGYDRDVRRAALMAATATIDAQAIAGEPYVAGCQECGRGGQALRFPRVEDRDSEGSVRVPDGVCYATCELALFVLRASITADNMPRRVRKLLRPFIVERGT